MNGPRLVSPLGDWSSLEAGIVSGEVMKPGTDVRSHVFYWVEADRDGPLTRQLLTFATDRRVPVRRTVFALLSQWCFRNPDWPLVAAVAESALDDGDPQVRRTAAKLLADTAGCDRALAALSASADPVVRIALVEAMPWHKVAGDWWERLRPDSVPGVRLLANVASFSADETAWPALDAAILADLETPLPSRTAAQYWAQAMINCDREEACYAWAERLANRLEGVRMAVAATRRWRAAPARMTPMLTVLLQDEIFTIRAKALAAIAASLTASRLAADDLAALLDDPELGAVAATALGSIGDHRAMPYLVRLMLIDSDRTRLPEAFRALSRAGADPAEPVAAARQILIAEPATCAPCLPLRVLAAFGPAAAAAVPELIAKIERAENDTPSGVIHVLSRIGPAAAAAVPLLRQYPTREARHAIFCITPDRALAEEYLAALPEEPRRGRNLAAPLTWLAEHGGLTARQHKQLRSLFRSPGFPQVESAGALWLHEGPAAAAELLEALPQYLSGDLYGIPALRVFAAMGQHARPILDLLDRFIGARHRVGMNIGDEDLEMRADEKLLEAVIATRRAISLPGVS